MTLNFDARDHGWRYVIRLLRAVCSRFDRKRYIEQSIRERQLHIALLRAERRLDECRMQIANNADIRRLQAEVTRLRSVNKMNGGFIDLLQDELLDKQALLRTAARAKYGDSVDTESVYWAKTLTEKP